MPVGYKKRGGVEVTEEAELPSFNETVDWLKEKNLASSSGKIWVPLRRGIPDQTWDQISKRDQDHLEAASNVVNSLTSSRKEKVNGEDVDFRRVILENVGVGLVPVLDEKVQAERKAFVRYRGNDEDSAGYLLPAVIYERLGVKDPRYEPYPCPEAFLEEFQQFLKKPEQIRTKKVIDLKVEYDNKLQSEIQEFTDDRKKAYIAANYGREEYREWCCEEGCSDAGCDIRDGRLIEGDHKKSKRDGGEKNGKPSEMSNPVFRKEKPLLQRLCRIHHGLKTKDDDDKRGARNDRDNVRTAIHYELVNFLKEKLFERCCSCGLSVTADTTRAFDLHHPFDTRGCLSPYGTLLVKQKLDGISRLISLCQIKSYQEFKEKMFPELAIVVLLCKNCHHLQTSFLEESTIPNPFPKKKKSKRVFYTATSDAVSKICT